MSPSGLKTWLAAELQKQFELRDAFIKNFKSWSYEPISIPSLVDSKVLERTNFKFREQSFKVVDRNGELLALRTELTQPIAKAIASRASELEFPLRLYYAASVFRFQAKATDDSCEIPQVGLELVGANSELADFEVLQLCLESIELSALENWLITITDARIWQAAFKKYDDLAKLAYADLLVGDIVAFQRHIDPKHPLYSFLTNDIDQIESSLALDLSSLRALIDLHPNIRFDALQTPDLDLYTGMHFNLLAESVGSYLAVGGRYDNLYPSFGQDLDAVGFAFYMPAFMAALKNKSNPSSKPSQALAFSDLADWTELYQQIKKSHSAKQNTKLDYK